MAVDSTTRKSTQDMTAVLTEFDFTFRALEAHPDYIKCIRKITASGVEDDLTYDADLPTGSSIANILKYKVTINDNGDGGTVRVGHASTDCTITIYRETADTQGSAYDDYNQFPADTVEDDFDKRTMITQELQEEIDRALKLSITSAAGATLPSGEANKYIGWNNAGALLENKDLPDPSATREYLTSFENADLTAGVVTITHSLATRYVICTVFDNNGKIIMPDEITTVDNNSLTLDLSSYGTLTGTWRIRVVF